MLELRGCDILVSIICYVLYPSLHPLQVNRLETEAQGQAAAIARAEQSVSAWRAELQRASAAAMDASQAANALSEQWMQLQQQKAAAETGGMMRLSYLGVHMRRYLLKHRKILYSMA